MIKRAALAIISHFRLIAGYIAQGQSSACASGLEAGIRLPGR